MVSLAAPASALPDNPFLPAPPADTQPPTWAHLQSTPTPSGETILLMGSAEDNVALDRIDLQTNAGGGTFATVATEHLAPLFPRNHTALFAWRDMSRSGTEVRWRLVAYDRAGNSRTSSVQSFLVPSPPPPSPPPLPHNSTFTVCPSGCNFTRIQDAINAATPPDVVFVLNGTYNESVVINRSISVVGESAANTTIDGQGQNFTVSISIGSDNANLTDFTIRNGSTGVLVEANRTRVLNNTIREHATPFLLGIGVHLLLSNETTIQNNTITANDLGLLSSGSERSLVLQNNISQNPGSGIVVTEIFVCGPPSVPCAFGTPPVLSRDSRVAGNVVSNNSGVGISSAGFNNLIEGNEANGNGGVGLGASQGNVTFRNNTARNNANCNFATGFSRNVTVVGNELTGSSFGMCLVENPGSGHNISGNNVSDNAQGGIVLATRAEERSENNTIANNTLLRNAVAGIVILATAEKPTAGVASNYTVANNTAMLSQGPISGTLSPLGGPGGIIAVALSNSTLRGNTVVSNLRSGILLNIGSNNTVAENNASSNGDRGIAVVNAPLFPPGGPSVANRVRQNTASNNTVGILVDNSTDGALDSNNASYNSEDGIRLRDAPNSSLTNNIVRNNTRYGIYVDRSDNTPTMGNDARFNGVHGIFYNTTTNLTVTGNTVIGHTGAEHDGIRVQTSSQGTVDFNFGVNNFHCIHVNSSPTVTVGLSNFCANDIIVDPSPFFFVVGNVITNASVQVIDSSHGRLAFNIVDHGRFGFRIVNGTNITMQSDEIFESQKASLFVVDADTKATNVTFDSEKVVVAGLFGLTVLRDLDVIVTASGGAPVVNAAVTIFNVSGGLVFNGSTNSTGRIPTQTLVQFREDDLRRRPEAPYTITVSAPGFQTTATSTDLNESTTATVPLTPEVPFPFGCFKSTPGLRTASLRIQNRTFPINVPVHDGIKSHPTNACENEFRSGAFQFNRTEFINDFGGAPGVCLVTDIYTNRQGNVERLVPLRPCLPPVPPPPPPLVNLPTVASFQNNKTQDSSKRLTLNTSEEVVLEATFNQTGTFVWKVDGVVEKTEVNAGSSDLAIAFNDSEIHVVTLTVSNANGASDKLQWIFNVVPIPPPPPPPPPPPTVLFSDNFSLDANNDNIPDGWIPLLGTWSLVGGQLCSVGNTGTAVIYYGATTFSGDLAASVDIQLITGFGGLFERVVNPGLFPSDLYGAIYAPPPFFAFDALGLVEIDGFQQVTFLPIPSGLLPIQRIGGGVRGANLEGTVNGVLVGSAPLLFSPKLNTGFAGLIAIQGDVCFDNFEVRTVS
ncbi:MAG: right-handed parallel beta-helix repeat-containing protein [Halobacteria archaeon]